MNGLLDGLLYGLLLCCLVGPIFFKILHTSIRYGKQQAISLVAGQWLSDFIYIGIIILATKQLTSFFEDPWIKSKFIFYLGGIGSMVLALMSFKMLIAAKKGLAKYYAKEQKHESNILYFEPEKLDIENKQNEVFLVQSKNNFKAFLEGIIINTLNPFPIFFWLTLMSINLSKAYDFYNQLGVFLGTMLGVISTDLLKIYLALLIQQYLKPKHLHYLTLVCGAALLVCAIFLLARSFYQ